MHIAAPLRGSPLALLCSFTFFHILRGGTSSSLFFSFPSGHSHFLCSSFPHQKHFTICPTTSCLFTSLTLHCMTRLLSTSNLFPSSSCFFCFSSLLQFQVRCLNFPHCLHNLPSLSSNSILNLARAYLWLSMSLRSWLYTSKDIICCT